MPYHEGELEMQRRAGVAALAARVARIISPEIPPAAAAFLAAQPFLIVASVDSTGATNASLLGGRPGFALASSDRTIAIAPEGGHVEAVRADVASTGVIGLLAIDFATRRRFRANGGAVWTGAKLIVSTSEVYSNCPQYIRPRHALHTTGGVVVSQGRSLTAEQQGWIAAADFFFLATSHPRLGADASHRGGDPGFVRVEARRVVWPDYPGNNMFNSLGNLVAQPRCGLLFVDFTRGAMLQLSGTATVHGDADRMVSFEVETVRETAGFSG